VLGSTIAERQASATQREFAEQVCVAGIYNLICGSKTEAGGSAGKDGNEAKRFRQAETAQWCAGGVLCPASVY